MTVAPGAKRVIATDPLVGAAAALLSATLLGLAAPVFIRILLKSRRRLSTKIVATVLATLVINGPDGRWYCDDDGGNAGMNPAVRFGSPGSGQYDVWIGTYGNASNQQAQLYVSELDSNTQ